MTKRTDTLETVLLAIELLHRIPRKRKVTAAELHRQLKEAGFDRDLRTVQRQLETLSLHFAIERDDRTKPYGYRWLERAKALAIPNMTPQESLLFCLAEQQLRHQLPAHLMTAMEGFFTQAKDNLGPDSNATLAREWTQKVRVVASTQPLLPPKIATGVFESVSEGLYRNQLLAVRYRNREGQVSDNLVKPLGLVQQSVNLYLVCQFEGYDNYRNLALHRIEKVSVKTLTFTPPTDFDLARYDADGRFGFGDGKRVKLTFHITRAAGIHLEETPLSVDQTIEWLNHGRMKITATLVDTAMLDWWLRSFGDSVSFISKTPLS